jgi:hypothetical protein
MRRGPLVVLLSCALAVGIAGSAPARTVRWSGYTWDVKNSPHRRIGPGPNRWSDSRKNVWVDDAGRLHLEITEVHGHWYSAEVVARGSFGFGHYAWTVTGKPSQLDPNAVLGMFTWDDDTPGDHHREIDIEMSRWGRKHAKKNSGFTVQPYRHAGNGHRYVIPRAGVRTTNSFIWTGSSVAFSTELRDGAPVSNWTYSGPDVPGEGTERPRINLWLFGGALPSDGRPVHVVLPSFSFS